MPASAYRPKAAERGSIFLATALIAEAQTGAAGQHADLTEVIRAGRLSVNVNPFTPHARVDQDFPRKAKAPADLGIADERSMSPSLRDAVPSAGRVHTSTTCKRSERKTCFSTYLPHLALCVPSIPYACPLYWLMLALPLAHAASVPAGFNDRQDALPATRPEPGMLLSLLLWQPVVEELLFRGLLQEHLSRRLPGAIVVAGLSRSNLLTSLLFAAAHLLLHAPAWAAAVLVPSLVYGYFRDRYGSVLPALLLHVTYNACYFLPGLPG